MKILIAVAVLSVVTSARAEEGGMHSVYLAIENYLETTGAQYRERCIQDTGVDPALVDLIQKKAEMTNDAKLKCYIECELASSKIVDKTGIIDINYVKSVLKATNQKFLDMVEADCKHPKHTDLCEAAYEGALCMYEILLQEHLH